MAHWSRKVLQYGKIWERQDFSVSAVPIYGESLEEPGKMSGHEGFTYHPNKLVQLDIDLIEHYSAAQEHNIKQLNEPSTTLFTHCTICAHQLLSLLMALKREFNVSSRLNMRSRVTPNYLG